MGLKSIDMRTGEVRALTTAPTSVNLSTGEGTNYKTTWKKIGSALKKSPVKTGWDQWWDNKVNKQKNTLET